MFVIQDLKGRIAKNILVYYQEDYLLYDHPKRVIGLRCRPFPYKPTFEFELTPIASCFQWPWSNNYG